MRTSNNQITKKDLMSIYIRSLSLEYSWNYERQQHMGYCFAMLPAIKRIYEKKEAQIEAARRHMEFFNTTPYVSTAIMGISAAMEESNADNADFDTSSINSVKVALMGPLAGIGDSMFEFASALGTVGLSVGITGYDASPVVLWTETVGMLAGRLEIYVIFVAAVQFGREIKDGYKKTEGR